jgi:acyl-CoA synthetase (AMP-forming)/AMP-acid ligase II
MMESPALLAPRPRRARSVVALAGARSSERTWADLASAAAVLAEEIGRLGWRRPALFCADRYHVLVGLLGCWLAERPALLPPNGRAETWRELLAGGGADGLLHDVRSGDGLDMASVCSRSRRRGSAPGETSARLMDILSSRGAQHAVTIHTSGSTGEPAAIRKTAGQLLGEAATLVSAFGFGPRTRIVATAPPHHIYGLLFGVLAPLLGGGAFVREAPADAVRVARLAQARRADVLCAVPAHLALLEVLPAAALRGVRRVFSSGAALPGQVGEMLARRFGVEVIEILGSSESGGIAWRQAAAARGSAAGPRSDWSPLPGVRVAVAEDGVLLLDSPFVDPGAPRPWRGTDRIEMTGEASFRHLGRADDILKVAGTRVSLADIERRLLSVAGVLDARVIALPQAGPREHEICAAVVAPGLTARVLRGELSRWLDPITLPRRWRLVDRIPRAETGKAPRADVLALFAAGPSGPPVAVPDDAAEARR